MVPYTEKYICMRYYYFFGPGISVFLTGDPSVLIVWSILGGASANYIYFWHIKDHLQRIRSQAKLDMEKWNTAGKG